MPLTFSAPRKPPVPRWAKGAAIAFAVLGGGVGLLAVMVDFSGAAKAAIAQATKHDSGLAIKVGGKTVSHFFPPSATLKDVELQAGGLRLSGTDMTLVMSWGALFGDAEPSEVVFEGGRATLAKTDKAPSPPPATITFKHVRLPILEQQGGDEKGPTSSLDLTLRPEVPSGTASKNYITGSWSANGTTWQVNGQLERWFGAEPAPYNFTFTAAGTQATFKGQVKVDDKGWGWEGDGDIQSKGIWVSLKGVSRFWAHKGMEALPQADMTMKGHYQMHGGSMKLAEWQWASGGDKGSLNLELQPQGDAQENGDIPQSGTMQVHFEHLTLDGWAPLFNQPKPSGIALIMRALQQGAKTKISDAETAEYYSGTHSMLPNNVRLNVEVEVASLSLNGQNLPGLSAQGELADAVFTLNQMQAGVPGDGRLNFSGILKPTQDSWQLNGAVEVSSRSFRQLAGWLGEKLEAPEAMLGAYAMKANLAIEPGQVRLTEMEGTLDKSQYRGAFIFHLPEVETERLKLEAIWVADHVELDEYLPPDDWSGIGADDVTAGDPMPGWLKGIASDIAMQCRIGELTWRGLAWGDSQARFTLAPGSLDVSLFRANPGGSPIQGKLTMTAQALRPKLDLTLKAEGPLDARQVQTLILGKAPEEQAEDEAAVDEASWSEETIDTSWLSVVEGNLDLFLSRFNVRHLGVIDNLRMKGSLANRVLTVEAAQADMLGGKIAMKGQLAGGSLPSLSASFQTLGIRVSELLKLKLNTVHVDGALSMQGNVRAQGISPASWVAGLTSNIRFAIENLRIDGFDLDAIGRRVLVTRSAIDVSNLARLALEDGSSSIRRLDGNVAVQQGIAEFVVVNLSTDAIGGSLQGKTDLPRMLTNIRFTFTPQTTREDPPPAIHFDVKGPLLSPEKQLETSDLEAYIARQSVKSVE